MLERVTLIVVKGSPFKVVPAMHDLADGRYAGGIITFGEIMNSPFTQ